jgi:hypothetical protein
MQHNNEAHHRPNNDEKRFSVSTPNITASTDTSSNQRNVLGQSGQTQYRSHLSRFIVLEAWTAEVKLQNSKLADSFESRTVTAIIGHEKHPVTLSADSPIEEGFQGVHECIGILLSSLDAFEDHYILPLLLVTQREGYWDRVGSSISKIMEQMTPAVINEGSIEEWKRSRLKLERRELRLG